MEKKIYYSQHGEDAILASLLGGVVDGYFVEVGCIDGKRFSNTLFFEKTGWRGMCIEAHSDYIDLINESRPGSTVVHAAVGAADKSEVTFFANSRGTLSSLDKDSEKRWKRDFGKYFTGFVEQTVPLRTLDSLFQEYGVDRVDVLSIDVEGLECDVVKGLLTSKIRPEIIVAEFDSQEQLEELTSLLSEYHFLFRHGGNGFFSKTARRFYFNEVVRVCHTVHPLDEGEDEFFDLAIEIDSELK